MDLVNSSEVKSSRLVLTTTWNPRGELSRFERLLPLFMDVYDHISISFPPIADPSVTELFTKTKYASHQFISVTINHEWSWGRYTALKMALDANADHIQYGDMDRILRWIETRQDELRRVAKLIMGSDCLIIGRTESAYSTHPNALRQTEAISNRVVSFILKKDMDVSAGSKGFSRRAAEFIISNCSPGHALGTDSEWPIVLSRAGFSVDYQLADGLTWESADRYKDHAANTQEQLEAVIDYDSNPENWAYRVSIADEIIRTAFESSLRSLDGKDAIR